MDITLIILIFYLFIYIITPYSPFCILSLNGFTSRSSFKQDSPHHRLRAGAGISSTGEPPEVLLPEEGEAANGAARREEAPAGILSGEAFPASETEVAAAPLLNHAEEGQRLLPAPAKGHRRRRRSH